MRTFVYKFEMSEEEWLRIHGKLDEAIRLLHELANDDYTASEAIAADDALSDLESAIDDYEIKEEPEMGSEERVTLEMSMEDYGYIVNALKTIQHNHNVVDESAATLRMSMAITGSLNILERSIVEEPEEGIEMSEEEWNKIRNGAMSKSKANAKESNKPTSGRYEWKDNMPIYGPDPWKEIDILKETIKTQSDVIGDVRGRILPLTDMYNDHEDRLSELYEEVNNIKDLFKSYDNADKALHRRLLSIENQLGRELYDYKNKVALDIASIDNRIHDYEERLTAVEDRLDAKMVDIVLDNKNDIEKLSARTNRIYELIDANIKLDNKTDILEERVKNITETVDSVKTQLETVDFSNSQLWDIVTGSDDSIDERMETLRHKMDTLIERDECLFNKLHSLKDNMQELAKSNADKHNRLAMTVQNLKDSVEGKHDKDKLEVSSASFNIYFDKNKKEDDDE